MLFSFQSAIAKSRLKKGSSVLFSLRNKSTWFDDGRHDEDEEDGEMDELECDLRYRGRKLAGGKAMVLKTNQNVIQKEEDNDDVDDDEDDEDDDEDDDDDDEDEDDDDDDEDEDDDDDDDDGDGRWSMMDGGWWWSRMIDDGRWWSHNLMIRWSDDCMIWWSDDLMMMMMVMMVMMVIEHDVEVGGFRRKKGLKKQRSYGIIWRKLRFDHAG